MSYNGANQYTLIASVRHWIWPQLKLLLLERLESHGASFIQDFHGQDFNSLAATTVGNVFVDAEEEWFIEKMKAILEKETFLVHFYDSMPKLINSIWSRDDFCFIGKKIIALPEWKAREKEFRKLLRDKKKVAEVMDA